MENDALAAACSDTRRAAQEILHWVRDERNARRLSLERPALEREMRRAAVSAARLEKAVERPMCVGVFGASQAGKSYLISALAKRGAAPLIVDFSGLATGLDFLRLINPEGGEESTGVVTRFSMRSLETPEGYPVAVRLLSQADLVKILGNTYFSDVDLSDEKTPEREAIEALAAKMRTLRKDAPQPGFSEEDAWDLREYFERRFKGQPIVQALGDTGYWELVFQLAPTLPVDARSLAFAPLWGELEPFTRLWTRLAQKLDALGNPSEAYCTIDALVAVNGSGLERREDSIVNVKTLDNLEAPQTDDLKVCGTQGCTVDLARADLTALIAELRVTMHERPRDFFDHTDLLDFPGARENVSDIRRSFQKRGAFKDLFLRGKVAYLFERYNDEQELTGMLLCVGPSVQDVRTLPKMVNDWVDITHGASPAARSANQTALFLVLTKFDVEFVDAAGKSEDSSKSWTTRLENSLLRKFLGQAHAWPHEWLPGRPFDNVYWLRNPNVFARHILDYAADGRELGVRPSEEARIARARREFIENPDVQRHFRAPATAWDEAFRLDDGGVTYIANSLAPVCHPSIKLKQIEERLAVLRAQLRDRIRPYYVPVDPDERRGDRANVYQQLGQGLVESYRRGRLGSFVRRLGIDLLVLKEAIYRARIDGTSESARRPTSHAQGNNGKQLSALSGGQDDALLSALADAGLKPLTPPQAGAANPIGAKHVSLADYTPKNAQAAATALETWASHLYELADDQLFAERIGVESSAVLELSQELIASAHRNRIEAKIAADIEKVSHATDGKELFADKATIIAGAIINRFVSSFGASEMAQRQSRGFDGTMQKIFEPAPDNPIPEHLPPLARDFRTQFLRDWLLAMQDSMRANVDGGSFASEEDLVLNEALGRLISRLERRATA
jgi:hypothetical protein